MAQYYDNAVKYVMLGYSQEFAEFMVGHPDIKVLENLETEQPTIKSHQNDSTLKVQLDNETVIFHTEVQTDDSRKPMWSRLAGYNGFLIHQHEMPVYCNVLYLHPNAGRNDKGFYAYKGMGYEYVLRYKVIRLIEIDGQSILEKQVPALLPFTPLMKPSSGIVFEPELIYERLPEGIMQESPFIQYCLEKFSAEATQEAYKQGKKQGEKKGEEKGEKKGEKKGTIQSIISLLETQFQPDAVKVLEPTLESINDMQRLRELLLAAPRVDTLETFMQYMSNGNTIESENGGTPRS